MELGEILKIQAAEADPVKKDEPMSSKLFKETNLQS